MKFGRVLVTVLGCWLLAAVPAQAAIAFDAVTTDNNNFPTATTLTFSHTTSGSDRLLAVAVRSIVLTSVSATYNGVAMTVAVSTTPVEGGRFTLFYLLNPTVGANNVVVTAGITSLIYASSASYTGVLQVDSATSNLDCTGAVDCAATVVTTKANTWTVGAFWQTGVGINLTSYAGVERTAAGAAVLILDTNMNQAVPGSSTVGVFDLTCTPPTEFFSEGTAVSSDAPASTVNSRMLLVSP